MTKPFLLIKGELVQQTAASFGGNGESTWVDDVLCRDGEDRCTLRGETLAGALLATARKLFTVIPDEISSDKLKKPSVWRVFTSHPSKTENTAVRQNVRINNETGAAEDGALFDSETLAQGTRWEFCLEVDLHRAENAAQVKAVTLHALQQWMNSNCWLGRDVARGLGWFKLENVKIAEVDWNVWPNSDEEFDANTLFVNESVESLISAELAQPNSAWRQQRYEIQLHIAPPQDDEDYGIDFLSVGGHSGDALLLNVHDDLLVKKRLLSPKATLNPQNIYADSVFSYSRNEKGIKPYIAGSALRGVLRHAAYWWARKQGEDVEEKSEHPLNQLFGDIKNEKYPAGAMLISDAHLSHSDWQAVLLKMHAEDEFAGGVYDSALFDKLALSHASFSASIVIEAASEGELKELMKALAPALELARKGFLGLGGGAWRGFGHLAWQITELKS